MAQIPVGMQFDPGELIGNYGLWGPTTGSHFHGEATRINGAGQRGFVNGATLVLDSWMPGSDFWGNYEELLPGGIYAPLPGGWSGTYPR